MSNQKPQILLQARQFGYDVLQRRHALSRLVPLTLFTFDAVLCALIILKIPCSRSSISAVTFGYALLTIGLDTEIDWVAYMEQVSQYVSGERDYTKIHGGTGPLVYPAAHVYIYTGLYHLTDHGKDILLAQQLFGVLYMATLGLVMACYWKAGAPPYIFPLLVLSKRLHSIFVLRCFNDCFAVFFLWLAIFLLQRRQWTASALVYSWGLGVKMSLLLSLPAVGVVLFLGRGFFPALRLANVITQVQLLIGMPFLVSNHWGYLGRAFELSRQFFFKWTVNWRFLGEDIFLSRPFHLLLLGSHVAVLAVFIATRWLNPAHKSLGALIAPMLTGEEPFTKAEERHISQRVTPQYILTTVLTANVIGLLFARSLHYQFYSYLAWATPFLLWRSGIHPVAQYGLWALQEWAWNVYPSSSPSSAIVVAILGLTVFLVWRGTSEDADFQPGAAKPESAKR